MSVFCECCVLSGQVEVSTSGRSFVQRSSVECGVSECDRGTSTVRRPRPTWAVESLRKDKDGVLYDGETIIFHLHKCIQRSCVLHNTVYYKNG